MHVGHRVLVEYPGELSQGESSQNWSCNPETVDTGHILLAGYLGLKEAYHIGKKKLPLFSILLQAGLMGKPTKTVP